MADYLELRSSRGRLYYAPPSRYSIPDLPTGYFQPRTPRPHILRIALVSADLGSVRSKSKLHSTLKLGKLAHTRDSAIRFLRFVTSQSTTSKHDTSDVSGLPPISKHQRWSGESTVPAVGNMTSGDTICRNGRPRATSSLVSATLGGPIGGVLHRPSLLDDARTCSNASVSSTASTGSICPFGDEKPVASGNGVSVSISLAEPVLFLQGFDQADVTNRTTTLLRGSLRLRITKSAKIKAITLAFRGKAHTEWPEGIPPKKVEFKDTESIMNHTWPFFNAQFQTAELGHGADSVQNLKGPKTSTKEIVTPCAPSSAFDTFQRASRPDDGHFSIKEATRLSLQLNRSRSFGKSDTERGGSTVAQKGYRSFTPGEYTYNFELPIDSRLPETINVELGNVKYELEAVVERAGAFRANLVGSKELTLIRTPSENSLETVEPIAISRNWEDQLHYDIVISGKSFPLGAQVPIAFKLTPLAKVQCHRIKVYVTENIHYYTANKRVHRLEPTRKVQLFEKRADGPSTSAYPGSTVRITAGGGVDFDGREAAARGDESIARDTTNLLGNLEGGANIGPTEMEFNVQLPSCHAMQERPLAHRIHFDTTFQNIQVHHWIKIVLRLSKPDAVDPTKRRHFEISIDSPFNILSCRATQANTALPAYTSPECTPSSPDQFVCGCPGAPRRQHSPAVLPTLGNLRNGHNDSSSSVDTVSDTMSGGLAVPQAAHFHNHDGGVSREGVSRPMHLLRAPSFNPPAFDDNDPPPPLMTPPPDYGDIVSGDPRSGLADYFARLADEVGEDEYTRPSRIDVPLTPGGRLNRSMDERRTWLPIGGAATQ